MSKLGNFKAMKLLSVNTMLIATGAIVVISGISILSFQTYKNQKVFSYTDATEKAYNILKEEDNNKLLEDIATQIINTTSNISNEKELKSLLDNLSKNNYESFITKDAKKDDIYISSVDYLMYNKDFIGEKVESYNICKPSFISNEINSISKDNTKGHWIIDIVTPIKYNSETIGELLTTIDITNIYGLPKRVEAKAKDEIMLAKPIIYLYPQEVQNVKVKLDYDGNFFITYPQYDTNIKGWDVTAYPDGKIIDNNDNKEYSYIFWDGFSEKLNPNFEEGFIIKGSDTREFLQNILPKMGLTPKEYNEFIVYWLPIMQKNEYNLISFLEDDYTDIAKLDIEPKPDSILRVFMAFKGIDKTEAGLLKSKIKEPEIKPFNRYGFSVIEWGGSEIK